MREGKPDQVQGLRQRTGAMSAISQLHLAMRRPEDVIPYLGSSGHWRDGRSAKLVAESWFAAKDRPELYGLPEKTRSPASIWPRAVGVFFAKIGPGMMIS